MPSHTPKGYELEGNILRTRWIQRQLLWDADIRDTLIAFDNYDEDDEIDPVAHAKEQQETHIRVTIENNQERQVCMGTIRRWRANGFIVADIMTPLGIGPSHADRISDAIAKDWRGVGFYTFQFQGVTRNRVGRGEAGSWYHMVVIVDFYRDELIDLDGNYVTPSAYVDGSFVDPGFVQ